MGRQARWALSRAHGVIGQLKPFSDADLDLSQVLQAVVLGGKALGAREGAKKQRQRVPEKQERLIRLVAQHGDVPFELLCDAFIQEWTRIAKRAKGQAKLIAKREFFRNIADLVARINAALIAGYQDSERANQLLECTGGAYLRFSCDYQTFTVSWHSTRERRQIDIDHTTDEAGTESVEIAIHVDPVTGVWAFRFRGHEVEVETVHGFVKIDGRLYRETVVKGLQRVEELAGVPLQAISRLITQYEAANSSKTEA